MKKLNFTEKEERPYKFMGAMLAPKGAYYIEYNEEHTWGTFYPIMYIQLWQDPDGVVWDVPMWNEEVRGYFRDRYPGTFQEFIEKIINEDRHVETCLTCQDFITLCRHTKQTDEEKICYVMENLFDYVSSGVVCTTPELRAYFKDGVWGDLRTMEDDGTLGQEWIQEYLNADGSIKPTRVYD